MRHALFAAVALATAAAAPTALRAQTTVVQTPVGDNLVAVGRASADPTTYATLAQTFVAPGGARYLQDFTLYLTESFHGASTGLRAYVYNFAGSGSLTGPALFQSAMFAGSGNVFDFDRFTFATPNLALTAGATYAFVLSASEPFATTPDGSITYASAALADEYAGGALYGAVNGADFGALGAAGALTPVAGAADLSFRATFTAAAVTNVVPEPGAAVMVAVGVAGVAVVTRRRHAT